MISKYMKVPVLVSHTAMFESCACDIDDSSPVPSCNNLPNDQIGKQKMTNMIQTELHLNSILGCLESWNRHHASTIDQVVELLNAGVDLRSSFTD